MTKYIGANFVHGVKMGGIDSSYSEVFNDQKVLVESGIDFVPCVIGNLSEIYVILGKKFAERQPNSFEDMCICVMCAIQDYFGDYSNVDTRLDYYPDEDEIAIDQAPIGKVSDLAHKNAAMCVERAMVSQNLLKLLGFTSFYKCSGIIKDGKKEVHSYNLVEHEGKCYVFDATIPTIHNEEVSPLIAEIPKEVFDELVKAKNYDGIAVNVSYYNPLKSVNVEMTYDSAQPKMYRVADKQVVNKL